MPDEPSGTVTLFFTDIEGSTQLLQRLGDTPYARVLTDHQRLISEACAREGGRQVGDQGDGLRVAFSRAVGAVAAAVEVQRALGRQPWGPEASPRVRIGIHTGEPATVAGELVGLDLHRAARICAAGHGGQILVSGATAELIEGLLPPDVHLRDLGVHRLRDLRQPERLVQVVHPDLPGVFPPLVSLDAIPNNLPRQLTSFVGRTRELAEVKRLLSRTSVLTLTGIGGCGKTRLALEAAGELLGTFADGVWLVELGPLSEPALVSNAAASALRVRAVPPSTIEEALLDHLRAREVLLLLDNCEHLLMAAATLVEAVARACPRVRILATSREPLGVPGETVWRVPPLALPSADRVSLTEDLMQHEATRLFIERAATIHTEFAPSAENAAAVATVCRRLDGIPLAIELAANRVYVLPVEQIAARLNERFRLLTGGHRTAERRQQTLRGTLDWSYDLLSPDERALLRRLSVFAGMWTLESAEEICAGDGIEPTDVMSLLNQLVSKSLVLADTHGHAVRYRLLETVREYGRDRLRDAEEAAAVSLRHLHFYARLAEQAEAELSGADQASWLSRLEEERDNFRAALEWSRTRERGGEAGLRLAEGLWQFWYVRGEFAEGRMWMETTLSRYSGPDALRARALREAGFLAYRQKDYQGASRHGAEALALFRKLDDRLGAAGAVYLLAMVAFYQGDLEPAKALHEESLALRRQGGDRRRIAISLNALGEIARVEGRYAAARACYEESLQLAREAEDRRGIATATGNLGYVALHEGDVRRAASLFEDSLRLAMQLMYKMGIAAWLVGLGGVAALEGKHERAAYLFGAAESLLHALGASLTTPDRAAYDRGVATARTTLGDDVFADRYARGAGADLDVVIRQALGGDVPALPGGPQA